jgi:DNA polymerase-3 subunit alpha
MHGLEDVGMLKMDFLGLKTLTVIKDATEMVRRRRGTLAHPASGQVFDSMEDVPPDDPAVYQMLANGGTTGIFQFESRLASDKLRAMRCDRFEDLVATNALIRPGPLDSGMTDVFIRRKLGQEEVQYPHPELEKTLSTTYGVIVYQEQVMRIANLLAGFSIAEADVLRKAVGKKIPKLIREELGKFVVRAIERGVDKGVADLLAEQIETFGRYGFPRSHSVAYSLISYQTAWLKAHYPAEFMAALLSSVIDKTDDVVRYIAECRDLARYVPAITEALEVLPPDVNESLWKFTVTEDGQVRFGLGAVRGVGAGAVQSIIEAREAGGSFGSLFDFLDRIDLRALNKRACEALIAAGALDSFGHRAQLLAGLDVAYAEIQARAAEAAAGQVSLFEVDAPSAAGAHPELPSIPEWSEADRLAKEKEAVGYFISGHPLDRFHDLVRAFGPLNTSNLAEYRGQDVEIPCVVTHVARQILKKDLSEWGRLTVEDFHGTASVLAFGEAWKQARDVLQQDAVVLLRGTVSNRERDEDDPPIFVDVAKPLETVAETGRFAVAIEVPTGGTLSKEECDRARALLSSHPGLAPVEVILSNDAASNSRLRSKTLRVSPDIEAISGLREIFGETQVRLVRAE